MTSDGAGNLNGTADVNAAGTLGPDTAFTGTYTVSANGRGQVAISNGQLTANFAMYLLSGRTGFWCPSIPALRANSDLFIGNSDWSTFAPYEPAVDSDANQLWLHAGRDSVTLSLLHEVLWLDAGVQARPPTVSKFLRLCGRFPHGCTKKWCVYEGVNGKTRLESSGLDSGQTPGSTKAQANRR